MSFSRSVALCLGLSCLASAQETTSIYLRGELAAPYQHLSEAVGRKLGLGGSLGVDIPLEDGYRWRVDAGYTRFFIGTDQPGLKTAASVSHISVEGVYQLRDLPGPYLFLGIGGYDWSVPQVDGSGNAIQRRVGHAGATLGMGWRQNQTWMGELRATGGRIDPNFSALSVSVSVGMHF